MEATIYVGFRGSGSRREGLGVRGPEPENPKALRP